jgi:hypothetical protein
VANRPPALPSPPATATANASNTADPALRDQIDAAYRAKYHENSRLVTRSTAQRATLEIQLA